MGYKNYPQIPPQDELLQTISPYIPRRCEAIVHCHRSSQVYRLRHSHVTGSRTAWRQASPGPSQHHQPFHTILRIHSISACNWALPDPTPCFLWKRNMDSGVPQITLQDTYGQWSIFFALRPIRESTSGAGYVGVIFTAMYASPVLNTISLTKLIGTGTSRLYGLTTLQVLCAKW